MAKLSKGRSARRKDSKEVLPMVRIFIEGETEKHYFNGCKKSTRGAGFRVDVVATSVGKSGLALVQYAIDYLEKGCSVDPLDEAYIVFDHDSPLINPADREDDIRKARERIKQYNDNPKNLIKLQIIFSNNSFELWYVLHFEDVNRHMSNKELNSILSKKLGRKYDKPEEGMYEYLQGKGTENVAIQRAKDLSEKHGNSNPSTDVYKLVERLRKRE